MMDNLIHDRGRGPEIRGTRITVYNLLPHFLDAEATEDFICRLYQLAPEQVAAARAYVLSNTDILARHLEIESRMAAGNSPEVGEKAKAIHETFLHFREWLAERDRRDMLGRDAPETISRSADSTGSRLPTFKQWLMEHGSPSVERP